MPATIVYEDRDKGPGTTKPFAVTGNWQVQFGYGTGSVRVGGPECSFQASVKPAGSATIVTTFGDSGGGKGQSDVIGGSGTYEISVAFSCEPNFNADPNYNPQWSLKVID